MKYSIGTRRVLLLAIVLLFPRSSEGIGEDNPTGVTGQFTGNITTGGSYDPFTGNATRVVDDIIVPGSVGKYPLKWTRVINTRTPTGWSSCYGWAMSVRSSADPNHWNDEDPMYEGPDAVVRYPDGRFVEFYGVPGEGYTAFDSADTTVRLDDLGEQNYRLVLPDGGKVMFNATRTHQEGTVWHYTTPKATSIIDPYGQVTALTRDPSTNRLWRITEPGGRYLEIAYTAIWVQGNDYATVIDYVRAYDGRGNHTQTVDYDYDRLVFHGRPALYLARVNYDGGSQAVYTYRSSNAADVPHGMIETCRDVRYAGAMKNIKFEYMSQAGRYDVGFGQIKAERNALNGQLVSELIYPTWPPAPENMAAYYRRTERRGDDVNTTRVFQYSIWPTVPETYTDFESVNHVTSTAYEYPAGENRFYKIVTDANTHRVKVERQIVPVFAIKRVTYHDTCDVIFEYTDNNYPYYVASRTDENDKTTYYTRYSTNQIRRVDYPDGGWEEFVYNDFGQVLTHKRTNGVYDAYDHFAYDDWGRLVKRWDATPTASYPPSDTLPHSRFVYYDSGAWSDRVHFAYDQRGNSTEYRYDERGNVTRVTHADNTYSQSGYNPDGTLAWSADENHPGAETDENQRTRYLYDDYKRVTHVTNLLDETVENSYAPWNGTGPLSHTTSSVYRTTSPMNKMTDHGYDRNFRRTWTKQASGSDDEATTEFTYDPVGNLHTTKDPRTKITTFGYDYRNRQISVRNDELNETTVLEYDYVGNKKKEIRPDLAFRTWDYNEMNRLRFAYDWRMSDPALQFTTYVPDVAGNVRAIIDAKGAVYEYNYDLMNRKISVKYPVDATGVARTEAMHYDDAGNLDYVKNPAGQYKNTHYDNRNRPDHSWWDGNVGPEIVTHYDDASRVESIETWKNGAVETAVAFGYDEANRKIWEDQTLAGQPSRRVKTDLDSDGKRENLQIVDPPEEGGGIIFSPQMSGSGLYSISFEYTDRNQLKKIQGQSGEAWAFEYTYDPNGNTTMRKATRSGGNDSSTNCPSYDPLNRPPSWEQTSSDMGGRFAMSNYQYDRANREIATWRWEEQNRGEHFIYEAANQLATASYNAQQVWTGTPANATRVVSYAYTPDKLNRSSITDNGVTEIYLTPSLLNQYSSVGGNGYGYDDNFNLESTEAFFGVYDAANRLITASNSGSILSQQVNVEFVYDGLGRCVKRTIDSVATVIVYDGWKPIAEWYESNPDYFHAWNVYGPGADEILLRQHWKFGYTRYHLDRHGNVAFLLDNDGQLVEKVTYDAFGLPKITGPGGDVREISHYDNHFLFQGREYIGEVNIYDYRNRFYHPKVGRFLQTDPTGFNAGDMNLFRYCGDDPMDRRDPDGLADRTWTTQMWLQSDSPHALQDVLWPEQQAGAAPQTTTREPEAERTYSMGLVGLANRVYAARAYAEAAQRGYEEEGTAIDRAKDLPGAADRPPGQGRVAGDVRITNYGYRKDNVKGDRWTPQGIGVGNRRLTPNSVALSRDLAKQYQLDKGIYVNGRYIGNFKDTTSDASVQTIDVYDPHGAGQWRTFLPVGTKITEGPALMDY